MIAAQRLVTVVCGFRLVRAILCPISPTADGKPDQRAGNGNQKGFIDIDVTVIE